MAPHRLQRGPTAIAAVWLVVAALALWALYRLVASGEHHAFAPGAVPPAASAVTAGQTYRLALPGGVQAEIRDGFEPAALQCEWSVGGSAAQALSITPENADSKATNVVATFVAPYTGRIHVDCPGLGAAFIEDSNDASGDPAGLFLILATFALTVGVGLSLSAMRSGRSVASPNHVSDWASAEDDEVRRFLDRVHVRSRDREVDGADTDDVSR